MCLSNVIVECDQTHIPNHANEKFKLPFYVVWKISVLGPNYCQVDKREIFFHDIF